MTVALAFPSQNGNTFLSEESFLQALSAFGANFPQFLDNWLALLHNFAQIRVVVPLQRPRRAGGGGKKGVKREEARDLDRFVFLPPPRGENRRPAKRPCLVYAVGTFVSDLLLLLLSPFFLSRRPCNARMIPFARLLGCVL